MLNIYVYVMFKKGGKELTVVPRKASTVVLMDQDLKTYLTKRPLTMKFFGGHYVFPGGAIEQSDLDISNEYMKGQNLNPTFEKPHYVAAARELFEEVGILISDDLSNLPHDKINEYRQLLKNKEISFLQMLIQKDITINLDRLRYFGHRVTSKGRPIRFDTRFFLTQLPKGQTPLPDFSEIDEARWYTPKEALTAHENEEIALPLPTILALNSIIDHLEGKPLILPGRKPESN